MLDSIPLMCFDGLGYVLTTVCSIEDILFSPHGLTAGFAAGFVARGLVLPIDRGLPKSVKRTLSQRGILWGLFLWIYTPLSNRLYCTSRKREPGYKLASCCFSGIVAAAVSRSLTNLVARVCDYASERSIGCISAYRLLKQTEGVAALFCLQPPIRSNCLYFALMITLFEGARQYCLNNDIGCVECGTIRGSAVHAALGSGAAATASVLTFPVCRSQYAEVLVRRSALTTSLRATLLKEAPLAGLVMGAVLVHLPEAQPLETKLRIRIRLMNSRKEGWGGVPRFRIVFPMIHSKVVFASFVRSAA